MTDTVCANGRDGRVLAARKALQDGGKRTTVAAGHGSGADVYDSGVGSAKPEACKAWRNSGQVKLYLGGTASRASWRALPDCWPLMTGRPAALLHKAADSTHCTEVDAGDVSRTLTTSARGCTEVEELGKLGPRFLCPVRGWQRAGCNPTTAASPFPAAASPGSSDVGHSQLTDGAYLT